MNTLRSTVAAVAGLALAACGGDGTGPSAGLGGSAVAIKFGAGSTGLGASSVLGLPSFSLGSGGGQDELTVTGTDGSSLTITDIRLIVDEFELEPVEVTDCDVEPEPPECADFEARFFFIDVPLGGQPLTVVNEQIPVGMYDELEFEVEDVEVDADDPEDAADAALIEALFNTIRQTFPDWPAKASMLVVGSYTPAGGGTATSFSTYFEAEIEVELDLVPPLEITEDASRSVVVDLSPDLWFIQADGSVLDLSALDFATTGQVVEFDLEIEDGFDLEIET